MIDITYLKNRWPELGFTDKGNIIEVEIGNGGYFNMGTSKKIEDYVEMLDRFNGEISTAKKIMEEYPSLYIVTTPERIFAWCAVMVKGKKTGGTGIKTAVKGGYSLKGYLERDPVVIALLENDNKEALKASSPEMFYCSGHGKAEPISSYGYHFYAGKYCKQYGLENPAHLKMAMEETYR